MSRSNGSGGQGGQPQQWRQPADPNAPYTHPAPPQQVPRTSWPPEPHPADGHGYEPAPNGHYTAPPAHTGPGQPHHAGNGYHFPQSVDAAPRTAPPPLSSIQRVNGESQGYDRYQPQVPAPSGAHQSYPPVDHRQPHAQAPMQPTWPPAQDPRGYDLGNYMPTNGAGHGDPHMAPGQHQQPHPAQQWPAQGAYGSEPGEPSLDTAHYGAPQQDTQLAPHDPRYAEADEYEEAEDEEPGRGRRGLMIVAALVGAIALGGGLAYAYKTFGSRLIAGNKSAPVVKAPVDANKAKPATPGGKEFAHTDKKLLNERVGADGQPLNFAAAPESPAASQMSAAIQAVGKSGDNDPSGARAVRTITITPPGNAAAPPPVAVPPPQSPAAAPQPLVTSAAPAAPTKLVTAAAPTAPPKAAPSPPAAPVAEPKAEPKKAAVPIARAGAPTEPASGVGGPAAGFVAVILSRTTKVDAMKGFADLQQKYAEVLGSKPAEVKEANLGDKGVWYRAVVGPPGSRDAANTVCNQLKTAGFTGCWVSTY